MRIRHADNKLFLVRSDGTEFEVEDAISYTTGLLEYEPRRAARIEFFISEAPAESTQALPDTPPPEA